jgi:hypothetical protein
MAKNITLLGANYLDVPAVQLPQTGGGVATFMDVEGIIQSLPDNSDLNTVFNGIYKVTTTDSAQTISHCPITLPFLLISSNTKQTGCIQFIATDGSVYVRRGRSTAWNHWYQMQGTDTGS